MTIYMIRGETVTAHPTVPVDTAGGELLVRSVEDLEASTLTKTQLTAIWNALPGTSPVKFKDRKSAAYRLWAAFADLPLAPQPRTTGPRAGSKQARVITLLERAEGATVEEIGAAMGWQHHTVRGMISGALKKKLGLEVVSEKGERGRVYRIPTAAAA